MGDPRRLVSRWKLQAGRLPPGPVADVLLRCADELATELGAEVPGDPGPLLSPGEVGALFRVDPRTVTKWARSGRISRVRTPGGHSRFRESEVRALLEGDGR